MSTADELLKQTSNSGISLYLARPETEPHIVIGEDRVITVPEELKRIAVQFDHNIETVTFDCPRYWDGHDMSQMTVYINYMRRDGAAGCYPADNVAADDADDSIMHFTWTISQHATLMHGDLTFLVCIKKTNDDGNEVNHWNSELCKDMYVSEGLECAEAIINLYPDIITRLLKDMDNILTSGMIIEVSAEKVDDTLTVTITAPEGTETFQIYDGKDTVYVGSGEMPEWANVQIDPNGDATLDSTAAYAMAASESANEASISAEEAQRFANVSANYADRASQYANDANVAIRDLPTYVNDAKKYADESETHAITAAELVDEAINYSSHPPIPTDDDLYWQLWNGTKYETSTHQAKGDPFTYEDFTQEQLDTLTQKITADVLASANICYVSSSVPANDEGKDGDISVVTG